MTDGADDGHTHERGLGVFGLFVVALGVVGVVVAFVSVRWLHYGKSGPTFTFSALRRDSAVAGFSGAYFSWLGWLMLVVTTAFAVCGGLRVSLRDTSSRVGALFSVLSAAMTLAVLSDLSGNIGLASFWKYVGVGPYWAMIGFLLIGLGGFLAT